MKISELNNRWKIFGSDCTGNNESQQSQTRRSSIEISPQKMAELERLENICRKMHFSKDFIGSGYRLARKICFPVFRSLDHDPSEPRRKKIKQMKSNIENLKKEYKKALLKNDISLSTLKEKIEIQQKEYQMERNFQLREIWDTYVLGIHIDIAFAPLWLTCAASVALFTTLALPILIPYQIAKTKAKKIKDCPEGLSYKDLEILSSLSDRQVNFIKRFGVLSECELTTLVEKHNRAKPLKDELENVRQLILKKSKPLDKDIQRIKKEIKDFEDIDLGNLIGEEHKLHRHGFIVDISPSWKYFQNKNNLKAVKSFWSDKQLNKLEFSFPNYPLRGGERNQKYQDRFKSECELKRWKDTVIIRLEELGKKYIENREDVEALIQQRKNKLAPLEEKKEKLRSELNCLDSEWKDTNSNWNSNFRDYREKIR